MSLEAFALDRPVSSKSVLQTSLAKRIIVDGLAAVEADLNYLAPTGKRPRTYVAEPPAHEPRTTAVNVAFKVPIRDGRPIADQLHLDEHGFELVEHRSAVENFYDDAEVKSLYYAEASRLLKELTGAFRVLVFDHTTRRRIPDTEDRRDGVPQPVNRVHVDYTAKSGPQRVRDLIPEEAPELLRGRVQVINLWRPIRGPLRDAPLALCDARSVAFSDLVPSDLIYPNRVGETYAVSYRPAHRWYYFSKMRPDEVLLLKCYDSAADGRARFAPHSAFIDPTTPPDARPRESIELRALVFHPAR
jgi:hypothetical protein